MNLAKAQTGRTQRMLDLAKAAARNNPDDRFVVIFESQSMTTVIKNRRMPDAPRNLIFTGVAHPSVSQLDINRMTVVVGGLRTAKAFIDHSVFEMRAMRYDAKVGEFGYKGDAS